ncbi:MAG TPA: FAD-dependent oxidoreductase [Burkholderiaceae bacterium]|nr:FAD-dependent oxidoreductase [Burkholderiaceae bacterium]
MRSERLVTDILIVGGGMGGVAAALAAARLGRKVVLTEQTSWLGGQMTSQGVPPDEHKWIESTGCTQSYREFRNRIRSYYRDHYPMRAGSRAEPFLNPGQGFVSPLCCEPRVALSALLDMLAPYRASGLVEVRYRTTPVSAQSEGNRVRSVELSDGDGNRIVVDAGYVLDATELGDLLPLAGVEHVIGSESRSETGEPNAIDGPAQPLDQQSITWCFAVDWVEGGNHTIEKPEDYAFWRDYQAEFWAGPQLSFLVSEAITHKKMTRPLFTAPREAAVAHDLWRHRRLLYAQHFEAGAFPSDIVLLNCAALDYWLKPIVGVSEQERRDAMRGAMQLSYSFLYWLQTEAPRHDGGRGHPELRLRKDVFETAHGLAKYPYVRESRRIKAEFTILEQHVGAAAREGRTGAEVFHDSVGIGAYRLDLHPSTAPRNYIDLDSWPVQIPLGALLPVRVENLLPACKNIGATHITNGIYRVHPIEWNVGEAAGALAAFCLDKGVAPRAVRERAELLQEFQSLLKETLHIPLTWPVPERITRAMRYGSPSALHGGSWIEDDGVGGLRATGTPRPANTIQPG